MMRKACESRDNSVLVSDTVCREFALSQGQTGELGTLNQALLGRHTFVTVSDTGTCL